MRAAAGLDWLEALLLFFPSLYLIACLVRGALDRGRRRRVRFATFRVVTQPRMGHALHPGFLAGQVRLGCLCAQTADGRGGFRHAARTRTEEWGVHPFADEVRHPLGFNLVLVAGLTDRELGLDGLRGTGRRAGRHGEERLLRAAVDNRGGAGTLLVRLHDALGIMQASAR